MRALPRRWWMVWVMLGLALPSCAPARINGVVPTEQVPSHRLAASDSRASSTVNPGKVLLVVVGAFCLLLVLVVALEGTDPGR